MGQQKGMILLGHMMSEDFGMKEVAEWLRTFLSEVPIDWIPTGDRSRQLASTVLVVPGADVDVTAVL